MLCLFPSILVCSVKIYSWDSVVVILPFSVIWWPRPLTLINLLTITAVLIIRGVTTWSQSGSEKIILITHIRISAVDVLIIEDSSSAQVAGTTQCIHDDVWSINIKSVSR